MCRNLETRWTPPVPVPVVDSGPGPPGLQFGDKLRLPDFSSDVAPGPGPPIPGSGDTLTWPSYAGLHMFPSAGTREDRAGLKDMEGRC